MVSLVWVEIEGGSGGVEKLEIFDMSKKPKKLSRAIVEVLGELDMGRQGWATFNMLMPFCFVTLNEIVTYMPSMFFKELNLLCDLVVVAFFPFCFFFESLLNIYIYI